MIFQETALQGCFIITPKAHHDNRGVFVKTFHSETFLKNGLAIDFCEEYYTFSVHNVLRGMHFQLPPYDHEKLVYCVSGAAMDVVLDLRTNSPTFQKYISIPLSAESRKIIYIPKGMGHGFYVSEDHAQMIYKVTTTYSAEFDSGIRWDSCGISWPVTNPIISERDRALASMSNFQSPFVL